MNIQKLENNSDKIGVIGSVLCIIHCALLPLFFTLATGLEEILETYFKESIIDSIFIIVALVAVYFSSKNASKFRLKILFWSFFIIFSTGVFLTGVIEYSAVLTFGGSIGLILTHLLNIRIVRSRKLREQSLLVKNV